MGRGKNSIKCYNSLRMMISRILLVFLSSVLFFSSVAQGQNKPVTLEGIWKNKEFKQKKVPGFRFLKDGKRYTKLEKKNGVSRIVAYNISNGAKDKEIFNGKALAAIFPETEGKFSAYRFSNSERKILIATEVESIYRRSKKGIYYVVDVLTKEIIRVHSQKISAPMFSPNADKIAFVFENNLYYRDFEQDKRRLVAARAKRAKKKQSAGNQKTFSTESKSDKPTFNEAAPIHKEKLEVPPIPVTIDGVVNEVINGHADWVYEEEFKLTRAFEWSVDGNRIAYIRFDESKVPEFTITYDENKMYPRPYTFKYPKVGEENAQVSVFVFDIAKRKSVPVSLEGSDFYVPRIKWTKKANQFCIYQINRLQNELKLWLVDPITGKKKLMLEETNKHYLRIHDDLRFLENGNQFVWSSEKSGYNHLYLYSTSGKELKQLTKGKFEVTKFYGVDELNGLAYYQAAELNPIDRSVYRVDMKGKDRVMLSPKSGWSEAQFSKTFEYWVQTYSTASTPNQYEVKKADGTSVRIIEDNTAFMEKLGNYALSSKEFFNMKNRSGDDLNGYMIKPRDFDPNKKYPVLVYVYGGPGSQTVKNKWEEGNFFWFQKLAQDGFIVVSVDNRGTGARGEAFKKMTYMELGKLETEDQIDVAKYLNNQSYVDINKIGIFGWSYGGYMSSLCILKGNKYFNSAIAVAPVTNWKWYDSVYTERYMRTRKENEEGYEMNSPINFVDALMGDYLLVHGVTDDNVHFQNTLEMSNALINANKQFDTYIYPNRNHGIRGDNARLHLYTKMTNFLMESIED